MKSRFPPLVSAKDARSFTQTTEIIPYLFVQEKDVFLAINILFACLKTDLEDVKR